MRLSLTWLLGFERALALADDSNMADVWYNIGLVAVGLEIWVTYQTFRIAVSADSDHLRLTVTWEC